MSLRTACLFLFAASSLVLASCQNAGNPLGGATRMLQAMGRSVGIVSEATPGKSLRIDAADIERAQVEGDGQQPLSSSPPANPSAKEGIAMAR